MKFAFHILLTFCLTIQATLAEPNPNLIESIKSFFGAGSTSKSLNDTATDLMKQMDINNTDILSNLQDVLQGNATEFLDKQADLLNDLFENYVIDHFKLNDTLNILHQNETSNFFQDALNALLSAKNLSLTCNTTALSFLQPINKKICSTAPSFADISLRAQNLTEEHINNTLRSWFCSINQIFANQLVQSVDFTGLSAKIADPALKEDIMGAAAGLNRCIFTFISDINITHTNTSFGNCLNPIYEFKRKIHDYLGSGGNLTTNNDNQTNDILNALLTHTSIMENSIDLILDANNQVLNNTQNTTDQASNDFVDKIMEFLGTDAPTFNYLPPSNKTDLISSTIGSCIRCYVNSHIKLVNDGIEWGKVVINWKRAKFCEALQYVNNIPITTCQAYNLTNTSISKMKSILLSYTDIIKKNLNCFQSDFKTGLFSFILQSVLDFFASTVSYITTGILSLVSTINGLSADKSIAPLTAYLSKFNPNCTNATYLTTQFLDETKLAIKSCQVNVTFVPDLCANGFTFSIWNTLTSIKNYWTQFDTGIKQLYTSTMEYEKCIGSKINSTASNISKMC